MGILGAPSSSEFYYEDEALHIECPSCSALMSGSEYCDECGRQLYGPVVVNVSGVTDLPQANRNSS